MFIKSKNSRIEPVCLPELANKQVSLFVKREDELHPKISGNKYRKLAFNIEEAKRLGKTTLITFGGAFSNHILATAAAGKEFGFDTVGVIRGDELANDLEKTLSSNDTLRTAKEMGMQFQFVSRSDYRLKMNPEFIDNLEKLFPNSYILPEGGTNDLAIKGCEDILEDKDSEYDYVCLSVGTGGTISGVINSSNFHQKVIGFPALKGDFLIKEIENNKVNKQNWKLNLDYHFGGYAKINTDLITFINSFYERTGISLDPVYTGKLFFGIFDLIKKDYFPINSKILLIHTGGLQGIKGMNIMLGKRNLPLIKE
jgi:1-aminocyclopropane-1-carboxylate deaminase